MSSSPVLSLPLHLVTRILSELGHIKYLENALLSHRIFYAALKDTPSFVTDLLRRQFGDDEVFRLALIAHESSPGRRISAKVSPLGFLLAYREDPGKIAPLQQVIPLGEAHRIASLHDSVLDLRESFAEHTLRHLHQVPDGEETKTSDGELSQGERRRITRAFYRYQIYCNLFSNSIGKDSIYGDLKRLFFDGSSPWVNEQLGCVHDFLERLVESASELVPIQYGMLENNELSEPEKMQVYFRNRQWHLSQGLSWLHRISIVTSPEEQYSLLYEAKNDEARVGNGIAGYSIEQSLDEKAELEAILTAAPAPAPTTVVVAETEGGRQQTAVVADLASGEASGHSRINQGDDGPYVAWKESNLHSGRDMMFHVDYGMALRRVGYVMWDRDRIRKPVCAQSLDEAREDQSPTFASPERFMNVTRSMERRFRVQRRPRRQRPVKGELAKVVPANAAA